MSPKKRGKSLRIDVRDVRLPGGRFTCSARTTSAPEFRRREAAVRALIEAGGNDVLARIIARGEHRLHIGDVAAAVARGDVDSLRVARASDNLLLGATIDRLRTRKQATRSAGTQLQVEVTCRQLETAFGVDRDAAGRITRDVDLSGITGRACEQWLHGPKEDAKPWAPRTQGVKHAYAQQVWQTAIDAEAEAAERENRKPRLKRNPWKGIESAPIHPTRVIFLTAAERDQLLAVLDGTPLAAFMAVGYHAGLRVEEAVRLRTGIDVDLVAGVLHIQPRTGEFAWTTKTNTSRDVPVNATLRRILERHMALGFAGERYFFRTPLQDQPLGKGTSWTWWVQAYQRAGIKHGRGDIDGVVYHTGRHSFASLLIQQGISPVVVAKLLGNSYQEVVKTYGHLSPENLTDAVKLLERESRPLSNETPIETAVK